MPDGFSFQDALKPDDAKKPDAGFSLQEALPAAQPTDDLPWDVPMSGAQMRARQEADKRVEALVPPLKPDETISVGTLLGRIFARTFLQPAMKGGQSALGERPLPTGVEGLEEAALGATPFRAGIPAEVPVAGGARPRVEPSTPRPEGPPPRDPDIDELGLRPKETPPPAADGGFTFEEAVAPRRYERPEADSPSTPLESSGLDMTKVRRDAGGPPEPAEGTETVAQPQADGTVQQVQVKTGEPPPPAEPPPTPVENQAPIGPEFRQQFPNLSDDQFQALFMEAAKEVPGGIPVSPAATQSWLKRVASVMSRMAARGGAALTPESLAEARERIAAATPPEPGQPAQEPTQAAEQPVAQPVTPEAAAPEAPQPVEGYGGPWHPVLDKDGQPAKNHLGDVIYQNQTGARAIMDSGIPWSERLTKDMAPASPDKRNPRFMTEDEAQAATNKSSPPSGSRPASPKPDGTQPAPALQDTTAKSPSEEGKNKLAETEKPATAPKAKPPSSTPTPTPRPQPAAKPQPVAEEPPKVGGRKPGTSAIPSIRNEQEKSPAEKPAPPEPEWRYLGDNSDGVPVYGNASGVHSTLKNGVRSVESVRMRPTKNGMEMSVPPADQKDPEFRVVKPFEQPKPESDSSRTPDTKKEEPAVQEPAKPEPAAEPKQEKPAKSNIEKAADQPMTGKPLPEEIAPADQLAAKVAEAFRRGGAAEATKVFEEGTKGWTLAGAVAASDKAKKAMREAGWKGGKDEPAPKEEPKSEEPAPKSAETPQLTTPTKPAEEPPKAEQPASEQPKTLEEALAAADAAYKAHFPTFEKATADYRAKKIGDAEYLAVRKEHERLKAAWDKLDTQLRDRYDAEAQAEANRPLYLAFAEGRSPVPEPGEAYKGLSPPEKFNVRGKDSKGNTWVGTGIAIVRQDADKGFPGMAARAEARKKLPHRLSGINPSTFDNLTNDAGSDARITWKRIVTEPSGSAAPSTGKEFVIGTTPQGRYVVLEKRYFDLLSRAAGPDGTLATAEPAAKKGKQDTITSPVFARKPDGTLAGVGMPIRWLERSARIMATGTDGETVPIVAPPAPKAEQPADTPPATGKPELNQDKEGDTSKPQEAADAGSGQPSGNGGLGKPGSGSIRSPGSRSGGTGGKGSRPKLAPAPTDDVAPAGGLGNSGQDGVRPEPEVPGNDEPQPEGGDAADGRPGTGGEGLDDAGAGGKPRGPELDLSKPTEPKTPTPRGREVELPESVRPNFYISEPERMVGGGDKARFNRNRRAIEAFQSITEEGREPTDEELETMAGFTGWGSFGQDLFQGTFERQPPRPGWDVEAQWLRNHLGKEAWDAAHNSISNAHYTDPPTVLAMWDMVRQMGFKGGRVLEPSMGVGNFFGLMPRDLMDQSTLTGIELEPTTGGMAKLLYPQAGVFIKGYQESQTPDNFYDLVIGNWPFDATPPADRRYNRLKPTLHDYFYLKALDQTRPGGLVVGITSAGTMDKMDRLARMEMAKKGELVAAFRLPTGAFEKYAGTKVVTDIIILRKRDKPLQDASNEPWINTKEMDTPEGTPIRVNQYFHDHPENVLGTFDYGHGTTTFRPGMLVHRPENMMERLEALPATLPTDAYTPITRGNEPRFLTSNTADRLNSIIIGNDGNLYQVAGERMLRLDDVFKGMTAGTKKIQQERADQVRALVDMRKAYGRLIDAERDGAPDMEDLRKDLREQYEAYNKPVKGLMIDTPGMKVLDRVKDPNWAMLAALQRPDGSPALILTSPIVRPRRQVGNPSVADAYVLARNEAVTIDMDRIAELSGRSVEEAAKSLMDAGAVYRTPGGGYEPSDSYLSGNVRLKLAEAQEAQQRGEPMEASIEALKKAVPKNTPYYEIEAKFGAPWVKPEDYQKFIAEELLGLPEGGYSNKPGEAPALVDVSFKATRWVVDLDNNTANRVEATVTHGHPRYRFDRLLTAAMGNTAPRIMDPKDRDGGPYYNAKASEEVATRIQEIREKFQDWIWKDAERTVRLEEAFNENMNAVAKPHFDGSFMDMSGMALLRGDDPFNMRRHQANGIWRGIAQRRGLFAHEVGTGKTYTIGGIAIEGRRYGRWNKAMLIAHNANSKSVARDIQAMYPGAKVLSIDSDDLTPKTLKQSLYSIRNEDWDLVVVQHSHLNRFALKKETLMALAREQITAIEDEMFAAAEESGDNLDKVDLNSDEDINKKIRGVTAKQLAKQRLKILNKIEEQGQRASREDAIPFEDLGIDCILVDEAHEFKKPPIATRMNLKGLNTKASDKSIGLDFLTKYIKSNNNGNNVFLFTGTPITNSLNEIFNMSRYFMDDVMKKSGIGDWDTWFNTFADAIPDVELMATGDYETVKRLSSFNNVDELVRVMSQFTDVVQASDMPEFVDRPTASGKTLSSPDLTPEERDFLENGRTENPVGRPYKRIINDVGEILPEQAEIVEELRQVLRDFKAADAQFRKENKHIPVVVETEMATASLDPRAFNPDLKENPNNKINRVAKNVLEIYQTPKTAQMIFVDNGFNPGKRNKNFAVVPDLIDKLVKGGIPRHEIAVVAGGLDPEDKARIAADMNSGKIRVAIGRSDTLGVGVNAQDNLRAMHHMDAPWMPGELEQRDGRGHRAGNAWNTVLEYRYITEGIDGKRWQVLTIKDRFIKQFIAAFNDESGKRIGSLEGDGADVSEKEDIVGTLSAAAGDPRLMIREKLKSDVNRLQRREQQHTYGVADAARRARNEEEAIAGSIERLNLHMGYVNKWVEAQNRMEKAAEEAGSKNRWYDAVIDKVPLKTSTDIQEALDKRVSQLAQEEGKVKIGTINGFGIEADWPKGWTEPSFYLTLDGEHVPGTGMSNGVTVQRIVGRIQAIRNDVEKEQPELIAQMKADVEKLKKAAEMPFTQAEALLKKRQQLAKIEDDLEENPIPPPAWLRHGAPIDTPIWVDGQERIVRGHRMSDDYYVVTDEGEVPYMKVTDANGFNTFTMKPPPPQRMKGMPEWAQSELSKAGLSSNGQMADGAEVIWHAGDLVLVRARRDNGEIVFLGFKKGLPEDRQAHDVWDVRGAFEVKDIDRMRKKVQEYQDREQNRRKLEAAEEPAPEQPELDIVRGGHTAASGRYVSPAWNLQEAETRPPK